MGNLGTLRYWYLAVGGDTFLLLLIMLCLCWIVLDINKKISQLALSKPHLNLSGHLTLGPINTCERMIVALWNKTKYFSPLVHLISNHRFWWSEDLRNHSRQKYSKRSTTTNYFEPRQVMSNQILFICYFKSSSVKLKFPEILY